MRTGSATPSPMEAAVTPFLSPDGADRREAAFRRRLDPLTRQVQRLERNTGVTMEMLALFARFFFSVTPQLPPHAQASAQAKARKRYEGLVKGLGQRLQKGQSILNEIRKTSRMCLRTALTDDRLEQGS
jgi:hypothetical protein